MYQRIHVDRQGVREKITLAYPKRRNAISPQMINELLHALERARTDDAVRTILITGEGSVFSAGGDFMQMPIAGESRRPPDPAIANKGDYADLLLALLRCDKPTIARVNGHALGSGLGIVAACTFSVALRNAQFGTPEIDAGLFPMMILALLARIVPRRRLYEMMMLGEKMEAEEAHSVGLIGRIAEPGELDATVGEIETKLLQKSPHVLRLGMRAIAEQEDMPIDTALALMRQRFAENLATEDAREGATAFLEKRAPSWVGR